MAKALAWFGGAGLAVCMAGAAVPCRAETPRELLTQAGFVDRDRDTALGRIDRAQQLASAALTRSPDDQEAAMMQAMAAGYRAKLLGSRTDAIAARKRFEMLAQRFPRNAEAQAALGAWHVGVIAKLGRFVGRAAAGAQKDAGYAALDRSVAMGGNRAMFSGFAGLLRLELDPSDVRGRALVEAASKAPAPTPVDTYVRRASVAVLAALREGNAKTAQALADKLLPFGQIPND